MVGGMEPREDGIHAESDEEQLLGFRNVTTVAPTSDEKIFVLFRVIESVIDKRVVLGSTKQLLHRHLANAAQI